MSSSAQPSQFKYIIFQSQPEGYSYKTVTRYHPPSLYITYPKPNPEIRSISVPARCMAEIRDRMGWDGEEGG